MLLKKRKKRVPKLSFTKNRNVGYFVSYRDRRTGIPKKHRFGMIPHELAQQQYHEWIVGFLKGSPVPAIVKRVGGKRKADFSIVPQRVELNEDGTKVAPAISSPQSSGVVVPGSLLHIASSLITFEEGRTREYGEAKRQGSIHPSILVARKLHVKDFLEFMNGRHGAGAVGRMKLADLTMTDVEEYNKAVVKAKYSHSIVASRLQIVKKIIDRGGRPEHGNQTISWNWDSRDTLHGVPATKRHLPSVDLLRAIIDDGSSRERAMIWMAIGLGFGLTDLSVSRVGHIDEKSYDLRRGKTGIERYGDTPPMVWTAINEYLKDTPRKPGELLFVTRNGLPVVHGSANSIQLWWSKLRTRLKQTTESMNAFYMLRHLGASEYGSRPSCSISSIKRWLGHGASSQMADVYMKPVSPENRAVIEFVREALTTGIVPKPPEK